MKRALHILLTASTLLPVPAVAQDVVVMRRTVATGNWDQHHWEVGDFMPVQPGCALSAPARRSVQCVANQGGGAVDPINCKGAAPTTDGMAPSYATCTVDWNPQPWGEYAQGCSYGTTRDREVTCGRFTSAAKTTLLETIADASCNPSTRPAARSPETSNFSGCTFTWSATPGACEGPNRRRTPVCTRSGGTTTPLVVSTGCDEASRPAELVSDPGCTPDLLTNGGFETNEAWWHASYNSIGAGGRNGGNALILGYGGYQQSGQSFKAVAGKTYKLVFWLRGSGQLNASVNVEQGSSRGFYSAYGGSDWIRHETTVKLVYAPWGDNTLSFSKSLSASGPLYIDDVQLTQID